MANFTKILMCVLILGVYLYAYIYKQNELTALRLAIPSIAKELRSIQEENNRMQYEIENFESPIHLMELMKKPEFGRLNFAYTKDVLIFPKAEPLPGKDFEELMESDF